MSKQSLNILCISRFFKGGDFLQSVKDQGHHVFLMTSSKHKNEAWPWEAIDETFYVDEDAQGNWNMNHVVNGLAFKMRSINFDRLVALDDFDVENVAHLREQFRIPGMGETTSRYFRDKLAMRIKAAEEGIPVPAFTSLFTDLEVSQYLEKVPAPWLIKPRGAASGMGIKKLHNAQEAWDHIHSLGDERHHYLLEKFAPGDVYHVDGLNINGKVAFARASQYLDTPLEVAQGGGIFRSQTVVFGKEEEKGLLKLNEQLMRAFGMNYSASHSEFIRNRETGEYFFVETSCRVGGANIAEMVEASSGINLWTEWAKIEIAMATKLSYTLPKPKKLHAGIIVSLSRYDHPDTSSFDDPEICWRMDKKWHIGLIIKSKSRKKIGELLEKYTQRIATEYHASLPPQKPPSH